MKKLLGIILLLIFSTTFVWSDDHKAYLGVRIQEVTKEIADVAKLDSPKGALVASVKTGSPADKAGIKPGDIILEVDGKIIDTMRTLPKIISEIKPGRTINIKIWLSGEIFEIFDENRLISKPITVGALPYKKVKEKKGWYEEIYAYGNQKEKGYYEKECFKHGELTVEYSGGGYWKYKGFGTECKPDVTKTTPGLPEDVQALSELKLEFSTIDNRSFVADAYDPVMNTNKQIKIHEGIIERADSTGTMIIVFKESLPEEKVNSIDLQLKAFVMTGEGKSPKSNYLNFEKIGKYFFAVMRDATNELSGKIKEYDAITKFDGTVLKDEYELYDFLNSKKAGDFINLTVVTIDDVNKTVNSRNEKIKIKKVTSKQYVALTKTTKDDFFTWPLVVDKIAGRTIGSNKQISDDFFLLTSANYVEMLDVDFHKLYKYYDEVSKTKNTNLPKKPNLKKYVNLLNEIKNTGVVKSSETKESENIIPASSGTGFFISKEGHIITNNHVINACNATKVNYQGKVVVAKILARDRINDLALLQADIKPKDIFNISTDDADLLEEIYVAGYPFGKTISASVKVTRGVVSALSGLGDNYSNIQIDAALQPGNSGGPIIDNKGNVVGIAVSKLDYEKVIEAFGTIPENTNFGIKSSVLQTFIKSNNLNLPQTKSRGVISTKQIGNKIKNATVYLGCWMTAAKIEEMKTKKTLFPNLEVMFKANPQWPSTVDFGCLNLCKDAVKGMTIGELNSFCMMRCSLK